MTVHQRARQSPADNAKRFTVITLDGICHVETVSLYGLILKVTARCCGGTQLP